MIEISVVIPVYNAEKILPDLYKELSKTLTQIGKPYEIIMVEDCGPDNSYTVIEELAKSDPRVIGIKLSRNFGQHYAITAGLDNCSGQWVVVMDCDMEDNPSEISKLYSKALEGFDIVLAKRKNRTHSFFKKIFSRLFFIVFNYLSGFNYNWEVGNYRIISKKVVESINSMREQLRFFGALVHWVGFNTTSIDIEHNKRYSGKSSYTFSKLWKLSTDIIIAYSEKPLQLTIRLGLFMSLASFCVGIYYMGRYFLIGIPVVGWTTISVSLYFLFGIVIAVLGLNGIYLGKLFQEAKKRPLYIISKSTKENQTI